MPVSVYILLSINIALLLLVYRLYKLYSPQYMYEGYNYYKYKYEYLEELEDELDTGDLLLFSAYEFSAIRILSSSRFSHAAMVIKKDGKLMGVDMLDNDYVAPGVQKENIYIFDIKDRIMFYSGFVYLCKCNKSLSKLNKKNIEEHVFSTNLVYPDRNTLMKKYLLNDTKYNNLKSCVEYVVHLLNVGDIVDLSKEKIPDFMHNLLLISNGDLYSKPVRLLVKDRELGKNNYKKDLCPI